MNRKKLLELRPLNATAAMVKIAREDTPQMRKKTYRGGSYEKMERKFSLYMRCRTEDGILRVALYMPDTLRLGCRIPVYEVFLDREARNFITYDRTEQKWREAKVDNLPRLEKRLRLDDKWLSGADTKMIRTYLGGEESAYSSILSFQKAVRWEQRERRYKRETAPWDADMALIPALPKDWASWVSKVGIPQNFIFYVYDKRGAKQGFCTYCGKDVPVSKPRHGKEGRCLCCHRKITFKSIGKMSRYVSTDEVCVYLPQRIQGGIVIREFWAERRYTKENYRTAEVSCRERWRLLYDQKMKCRSYYWGWYKDDSTRWVYGEPSYSYLGRDNIYCNHGSEDGRVYGKTLPTLAKKELRQTGLVDWICAKNMVTRPDTNH